MLLTAMLAHQGVGASSDTALDGIEVIAEPPAPTGSVVHEEHTGSHVRIERPQLERADADLGDILGRQSGTQTRRVGGFGSFSSLTVRAATSAQTGVFLDGVLLNSGGTPVIDLSTLELLNLESVDLYRGVAPLALGHGTIGGAVNLRTLSVDAQPLTRATIGAGSFAYRRVQLAHTAQHGKWDIASAFSHQQSDNDFRFDNDNGTPLNPADDQREARHNAAADRDGLLLRGGRRWSRDSRTDLLLQVGDRELGVPEWRNSAVNQASYHTLGQQLQMTQTIDGLGDWNSRHAVFLHRDRTAYDDRLSQVGLGAQDTESRAATRGISSYWEHLGDRGTVGLSAEFRREDFDTANRLDDSNDFDAERDMARGVIHYVWFDRSERWTITPAVNMTLTDDHVRSNRDSTVEKRRQSSVGPQLGLLFRPKGGVTLRANIGQYRREPSFSELYGTIGLVSGNPALQAERGLNADVGIRHEHIAGWTLDASLFISDREELIATVFDARGIGHTENVGEARVSGIELEASRAFGKSVDLVANLTWQDPESLERERGFNGKQLPGEARVAALLRLDYRRGRWRSFIENELRRERFYDRANLLEAADSHVVNLGVDWQRADWSASLVVGNLGNDNIEDFNGFPRPGRAWQLSLTREF